jgi:2-amino-4-hydroxy-6-hydroxymethyldihydropteridine diphosphokinase
MTDDIYLLLGSNLDNRWKTLEKARTLIHNRVGEIYKSSKVYETAPWGNTTQPAFLNQVIIIRSALTPKKILSKTQSIETELGRIRKEKWGERSIDIDILYYNSQIYNTPNLKIPHPEIQNRRFTLVPLVEIAAKFLHPVLLKSNAELLTNCSDLLKVKRVYYNVNNIK